MDVVDEVGSNKVDVSEEAIAGEWSRIVNDHEAGEIPKIETTGDGGLSFAPKEPPPVMNDGDQIAAAELMIKGALKLVFDTFGGLDLPADKYDAVARPWAVVIVKHFDGGIFEFMAKYKDELGAAWATVVFASALRAGYASKKAKAKPAEAAGEEVKGE